MILKAEDTKKQVLGITAYNGGIRVRQADVLSYLREYGIEIEVYDKMYVDESGTTQYFIPIAMAVVDLKAKEGAEGETSHSENSISRSYENAYVSSSIFNDVLPYVHFYRRLCVTILLM